MIAILQSTYTASGDSWSNLFGILGQLFFLIFVFSLVVLLAIYFTKWVANPGPMGKYLKSSPSNIKIIERIGVSQGASVQLLKIGEAYVLIGVTKDNISFLTEVDKDEIIHDTSK